MYLCVMKYTGTSEDKAQGLNYYQRNKADVKRKNYERTKSYKQRNRQYVEDYLQEHPCIDCGYSDTRALEFDHVRDIKVCCVMDIAHAGYSLELLQEEIAKCEVRCANCHKIVTYERYIALRGA